MDAAAETGLYRLFTVDRRLLYLGIAEDPEERWVEHSLTAQWWPLVTHRTVEWFPDRGTALRAEKLAVQAEAPLFNIQHKVKGNAGSTNPTHTPVRNFRMPDDTYLAAKAAAKAEGVTLTSVLTAALVDYVVENRHLLSR